jgi:hypothetical protein
MEWAASTPPTAAREEAGADFFNFKDTKFLIYVCRLSNFFDIKPIASAAGASTTTEFRRWFAQWGTPAILRTDGVPEFTSGVFEEFMEEYKVQLVISSPHHPESNGHVEAAVKAAKKLLRNAPFWSKEYYKSIMAIRTSVVRSRGQTPASVVFGRELRTRGWPSEIVTSELPAAARRAHDNLMKPPKRLKPTPEESEGDDKVQKTDRRKATLPRAQQLFGRPRGPTRKSPRETTRCSQSETGWSFSMFT